MLVSYTRDSRFEYSNPFFQIKLFLSLNLLSAVKTFREARFYTVISMQMNQLKQAASENNWSVKTFEWKMWYVIQNANRVKLLLRGGGHKPLGHQLFWYKGNVSKLAVFASAVHGDFDFALRDPNGFQIFQSIGRAIILTQFCCQYFLFFAFMSPPTRTIFTLDRRNISIFIFWFYQKLERLGDPLGS